MGRFALGYIVDTAGQPITDQSEAKLLNEQPDNAPQKGRRPRRARRIGLFALISLLLPVGLIALAAFIAIGRPLTAPEWVRAQIEEGLTKRLPGFDVYLGEVSLVIQDNLDPRLRVRNLELRAADNAGAMELAQVEARLDFGAMMDGQIAPSDIRVSGVFLTAIRQQDGTFNISVGNGGGNGPFGENTQLATFGDQIESYLELPVLAALDSFVLEDMTLRYEDLRARQAWTVDSAQLRLERNSEEVAISTQMSLLGARDYATSIEAFLTTRLDSSAIQFGINFEDMPTEGIASQSAALAWLEIMRAPLSGSMRGETDEAGTLGPVNVALRIADGVLQPEEGVQPVPFESVTSYLTYDPVLQSIRFDELSLDSKWINTTASGRAFLRDMQLGLPKELLVQLELSRFQANPKELDDVPLSLARSFADFRLKLDPFELTLGQMVIYHGEHRMELSGGLKTEAGKWAYSLDGVSDGLDAEQVLLIWPDRFKAKLRKWIDKNIHQISLSDINLAVRSKPDDVPDVYVDFQFTDAVVKVLKTMPVVRGGSGYASLVRNQFRLAVEAGVVEADEGGLIDVAGTGFIVLDTRLKQSPGLVKARARGPVTAAMSLLDREPLRVFSKANLPVDLAEGQADMQGEVRFVIKEKLPANEVQFDARGVLSDVRTSHFIPGKEIRGNLNVHATNERVELSGGGTVGAVPFDGRWHTRLGKENGGKSWIEGTGELSAQTVEEFNIGLPPGTVSGAGDAAFEIAFEKGQTPQLTLRSDLDGVVLSAPPLGWKLSENGTGTLEADVTLSSPPRVDRLMIDAGGLKAEGDIVLREAGGLDVMQLENVEVGSWLRASGALRGRGTGAAPAIVLNSGTFDMRTMPRSSGGTGRGSAAGPVTANLNRVQVTDGIFISDVRASLDLNNGVSGDFTGAFLGVAPLSGTLSPHQYGTALQVSSPNGGRMAAAMGVLRAATRGALELTLIPRAAVGQYDGELKMANVKVQNVPLIAELLNAISVIGLIEQLDGPGLLFTDVYSRFRLTPEKLIIGEGSAIGPSLGVSADGTYTFAGKLFDFQGAVSPIYAVNIIGRAVSKRGEGLIGFNYTMKGTSDDPYISVNPLSALTPGFFREIFRRRPPDLNN
ncbi:DUF3971 domain-containing protein [Shimia abyssi]|uniref:Uncharacterized protein DUF3971 n=1 Tax=Shimia abyssi TaxID=1662395 RepID=A0A2P8FFW3_9RHOB|nr:DUF3971 domain-containing protein [Shimia abyssi]PSL20609.1 uncharacterized protein DUF3971 [Shimia abyssi]